MTSRKDVYLRQLIWAEYRAKSDKQQAFANIAEKIGHERVLQSTIDHYYERFKSGETSLFNEGTEQHDITQAIQKLPNGEEKYIADTVLFMSDDEDLKREMITPDGRFAVRVYLKSANVIKVAFYDLFHGEKKEITVVLKANYDEIYSAKLIDYEHLLILVSNQLLLLKVDYESWTVRLISTSNVLARYIVTDQLNERDFVIYGITQFCTGSLAGDRLVVNPQIEYDVNFLSWAKLVGNRLSGFQFFPINLRDGVLYWQYCEIDLATLTEQTFELPLYVNAQLPLNLDVYCWVENRLYAPFGLDHNYKRIFCFDSDSRTWTDTGIAVYGRILSTFVDEKHVMTLQVAKSQDLGKATIYRFALKKPDKLKNLAWISTRYHALLFNGRIYDKIKNRLPYGRGLRSLFVSDYE